MSEQKHPGGAPRKWQSPEALQAKVDEYFATEERLTVTGLAYHLGMTRQGLMDYQNRDEFADAIKRAKVRIEAHVEAQLMYGRQATGPLFNLKNNFGWRDQQQIDQTVKGQIVMNVDEGDAELG